MTEKKASALAFVLLLLSAVAGFFLADSVRANPYAPTFLPKININADGTVTPDTGYISRNGNIYTLTADINDEYSIDIWRSNIIFDGAGHTINITTADNYNVLQGVTNVTVKNLLIQTRYRAISLASCSNCTITEVKTDEQITLSGGNYNTIEKCVSEISVSGSYNNLIRKNNITDLYVGTGDSNLFFQNNIIFDYVPGTYFNSTNYWDNSSVGNYWITYLEKYPDASEIGYTGVGNKPYLIDTDDIDHFPLMYPYDIENDTLTLPIRKPEPFPTTLVVVASGVSAAVIAAGCAVYLVKFRKRRREVEEP